MNAKRIASKGGTHRNRGSTHHHLLISATLILLFIGTFGCTNSNTGDSSSTQPTPSTTPPISSISSTATTISPPPSTPSTTPSTTAIQQVVNGKNIYYDATCDVCHGATGEGGTGNNLRKSTLGFEQVVNVIRFGIPDTVMQEWDFEPKPPGLTLAQIEAVARYVMTFRNTP